MVEPIALFSQREEIIKSEGESPDLAGSETSNTSVTDENEEQFQDQTSSAKKHNSDSDTRMDSPEVLEESSQELRESTHSESEGQAVKCCVSIV